MKEGKIYEKFLNLGVGSAYFLVKNLKKIMEEIEKEGKEHSELLENIKGKISKLIKMPKNLIIEFLKSCDFITKEDLEKFKQDIKNG
ncbi:MAG: hypothetical protein NC827_02845 [Candidatus Omnitrophica bacterium]|nr:hypothetical protein [Candidatus Omnitrophota bacterium]MCM8802231.1 hypothetical protein [Candidatus Omnitrophota bacterium]